MRSRSAVLVLLGAWVLAVCDSARDAEHRTPLEAEAESRRDALAQRLAAAPDTALGATVPLARWVLPPDLAEVSGMALTDSGNLLVHGDERGRVAVIDPRSGLLSRRFSIGHTETRDDFEAITLVNGIAHLVTSDGRLYQFSPGPNGSRVPFTVQNTGLGSACEFEGAAFDSARGALVLACKNVSEKSLRDHLVLWRWSLDGSVSPRATRLAIPLASLASEGVTWKDLHPSDITVDPVTGNYVLVAAQEYVVLELTPSGQVVRTMTLSREEHPQTEGVALTRDGVLIVSDEARGRQPTLTLYRWPRARPTAEGTP